MVKYKHWVSALNKSKTGCAIIFLKDKTEVIVFEAKKELLKVSTQLQWVTLKTTNQARNLGVVMGSDLDFKSHIKTITKSAYFNLRNISRFKGFMSQQDLKKLVHALIFSRLDYCNGAFAGLPKKKNRQLIVNSSSPHSHHSCIWLRTLLLRSSLRLRKWVISFQFPDFNTGFLSVKQLVSKYSCWFIKHWVV